MKTIQIRVTDELHRRLRLQVAEEATSVQAWVNKLLEARLRYNGHKEPDSQEDGTATDKQDQKNIKDWYED